MSVLHVNVRSLKKNYQELEALITSLESPPEILCLTETWLSDSEEPENYLVCGYKRYCVKNRAHTGGGVMIQMRDNLTILREIPTKFNEALFLEVEINSYKFKVLTIYVAPRVNKLEFVDTLDVFLESFSESIGPIVICGDTNIDILKENNLTKNYKGCIASNGFVINEAIPTRVVDNSSTCLDDFIFTNIKQPEFFVLDHNNFTDHYPIHLKWYYGSVNRKLTKKYRDTSFLKCNIRIQEFSHQFCTEIQSLWELVNGDIESSYEFFENTFLKTFNKFAPIRTGNVNRIKKIPWLSNSIKNLKTKRNKAHRQWKSSQLEADLNTFKYLRAKLSALITKTKRNYYRDKFNQSIGDSRQVYKLLNDIRGINNKSEVVPKLKDSNDTDLTANEIVEKFNMHFTNIGGEIQKNVQNSEL